MALPKRISDLHTSKASRFNDDGCMECGGPGLADMDTNEDWEGDCYYVVEGSPFCSVDCFERWHGIELL